MKPRWSVLLSGDSLCFLVEVCRIFCDSSGSMGFFMLMGSNGDSMLNISLETRIEDYVSLFFSVVFSIGRPFELPVVVVGCYMLGLVDRRFDKHRRYAGYCL